MSKKYKMETKQVIVMRTKYKNEKGEPLNLRKGKMIAQGCHASLSFLSRRVFEKKHGDPYFSDAELHWFENSFAKICLQVDTEEDLMEVYEKAKAAGLEVHLITDSGRTEFHEPTKTCLAIGPDECHKIDPITSHLRLL
jgi:PTH2 family peptidyl-tRNA hydrolase